MSDEDELAWFGPSWGQPGNAMFPHIDTPVGNPCSECGIPFTATDQGLAVPPGGGGWEFWHRTCWAPKPHQDDAFDYDEFGPPD